VLEIRDLWPDYFEEMGVLTNKTILSLLYHLEAYLYREADAVVTVAESAKQRLIHEKGVDESRVFFVPNGAELGNVSATDADVALVRERLRLDGKFVVAYVGNHGLGQQLQNVVETAALTRSDPNIHYLFVGDGAEKTRVMRGAEDLRLSNITFLGTRPREDVPVYYRAADVCLVPLADIPSFRNTIPSKIFEILGSSRPVIGALEGEGADVIRRSGAGVVVPAQNPQAMARAIVEMKWR
jgi:glycosyltransferase involved in cell wall biosynthesis